MTHVFRSNPLRHLGTATAIVLLSLSTTAGQPQDKGIRRTPFSPLPAESLRNLSERALPNLRFLSLTPPLVVSPAFPYKEGRAYFRAVATSASMIFDARADGLLISPPPAGKSLDVFVHGAPSKATLIDCTIDLENASSLEASFRSGASESTSVPDPQGRKVTVSGSEGHFVFAVPGDIPSQSPTNWFSLHFVLPATGTLIFYGCSISIAN